MRTQALPAVLWAERCQRGKAHQAQARLSAVVLIFIRMMAIPQVLSKHHLELSSSEHRVLGIGGCK